MILHVIVCLWWSVTWALGLPFQLEIRIWSCLGMCQPRTINIYGTYLQGKTWTSPKLLLKVVNASRLHLEGWGCLPSIEHFLGWNLPKLMILQSLFAKFNLDYIFGPWYAPSTLKCPKTRHSQAPSCRWQASRSSGCIHPTIVEGLLHHHAPWLQIRGSA